MLSYLRLWEITQPAASFQTQDGWKERQGKGRKGEMEEEREGEREEGRKEGGTKKKEGSIYEPSTGTLPPGQALSSVSCGEPSSGTLP